MNAKNTMKWLGLLALAMMVGVGTAKADPNTANDSGNFTVRITPNVDLGVTVDTTGAGWLSNPGSLDTTMALNATDKLSTGVKLTVAGDFNNQEFSLSAAALDTWQLDTANVTPGADQVNLWALIGDDVTALPADALYVPAATTNLVGVGATRAGQVQADEGGNNNHVYEFATGQSPEYADVDGMAVAAARRLWLRMATGSSTSSDEQQRFTVTVTAVTGRAL